MSEKDVQHDVANCYAAMGAFVAWTSVYRQTRVTPGLPDLIVLLPYRKGVLFHEVKAPGGKQSPAQVTFEAEAFAAGVPYVLGGVAEAKAALRHVGLIPE